MLVLKDVLDLVQNLVQLNVIFRRSKPNLTATFIKSLRL